MESPSYLNSSRVLLSLRLEGSDTREYTMISILLVDDEAQFLEVTRMFLERGRGIQVTTAISGDQALEILKNRKFDAIISDYAMPGINGIEFMKQVKSLGDDTPFIIFTGKGREDVVIDALNFGADLYLEKGPDPRAQFSDMMQKIRGMVSVRADIRGRTEMVAILTSIMRRFPGMFFRMVPGDSESFIFASPGAEILTGYTPGDLVEKRIDFHALIFPEDLGKVREARDSAISSGGSYQVSYRLLTRTGSEKRVNETGYCIENGRGPSLEGYILDIDTL